MFEDLFHMRGPEFVAYCGMMRELAPMSNLQVRMLWQNPRHGDMNIPLEVLARRVERLCREAIQVK